MTIRQFLNLKIKLQQIKQPDIYTYIMQIVYRLK